MTETCGSFACAQCTLIEYKKVEKDAFKITPSSSKKNMQSMIIRRILLVNKERLKEENNEGL